MFSCLCERAVFENRFEDCVCDFKRKFCTAHFCWCIVNSLHWNSKLQVWNRPNVWTCPRSSAYSVDYLLLSSSHSIRILKSPIFWHKKYVCFHVEQWMSIREIQRVNLWQAPVKWTSWGARYPFIWSSDIVQMLYLYLS